MKHRIHIRSDLFRLSKRKPRKYRKREHNNPPKGVRKMGNHLPDAFLFTKPTHPSVFTQKSPQYQGYLLFFHLGKRLPGICRFKKIFLSRTSLTYIKKHRLHIKTKQKISRLYKNKANRLLKSAAVLKGIAALFHSTKSYPYTFVSANNNGFSLNTTCKLRQTQAFLFQQIVDKPCFNPGCRSPPFSIRL